MDDFIFGTMDTDALRLKQYKATHLGITHLSARSPMDPQPGAPVTLCVTVGQDFEALDAWVYYSTDGIDPQGEKGRAVHGRVEKMHRVKSEWDDLTWGYVHTYACALPGQPDQTVVRYRISIVTPAGEEIFADAGAWYAYAVDTYTEPEWVKQAVIYHIMVDRFATPPGVTWNPVKSIEEIYGGNLKGILSRLDYLGDLGINTLYLSPIFPSDNHHRYNATDYFEIDPAVGTKEDFKALLDAAHGRGMHLILDYVPNHWSDRHATFQSAISDPQSPYRDWYVFSHYPDQYECFFNVPLMPKINLRNPAARKHIIDSACYWLEFGVDGLRMDYAIGPTPDFWADLRLATRRVKPDCWTFGEVVDSINAQAAFEGLLDGCLDFVLLEALRQTFATHVWTVEKFVSFLKGHQARFPRGFSRPCFLDNHDMDRFLWGANGDKNALKLAALCQFTLPGTPLIFYGTEVGLSQERPTRGVRGGFGILEEARLPMPWDETQDADLLAYYQGLIALRRAHEALQCGDFKFEAVNGQCFAYSRALPNSSLLCVFNVSQTPGQIEIPAQWSRVIFSTEEQGAGAILPSQRVSLAPMSGIILQ